MSRNPITTDTRYVAALLVTDTIVYEIIGRTACTLKLRPTRDGEGVTRDTMVDGGTDPDCPPVLWTEQVPDEAASVIVVRRREDGSYRIRRGNPLAPCCEINGKPARRTDYRF